MVNFINFLAMLMWATFKLLASTMMCCVSLICLKSLLPEAIKIVSDFVDKTSWAWEEIKLMERSEYGD